MMNDNENYIIDYDRLKVDLLNKIGVSIMVMPAKFIEYIDVQKSFNEQLIPYAIDNGFDLNDYVVKTYRR